MAIVDCDLMMTMPKGLTSASGIDALTHALEAYASMMATDYTDGLALKAMRSIFDYLPRAYTNGGSDPEAREKMANASTMAGMAFANAVSYTHLDVYKRQFLARERPCRALRQALGQRRVCLRIHRSFPLHAFFPSIAHPGPGRTAAGTPWRFFSPRKWRFWQKFIQSSHCQKYNVKSLSRPLTKAFCLVILLSIPDGDARRGEK